MIVLGRRHRTRARSTALLALLGALVTAAPASAATWTVERAAGADRYGTAVAISQRAFPGGSDVVVLAGGSSAADALAAAPLAGVFGAPLLTTPAAAVPELVLGEVQRLGASAVLVVGGPSAVADPVVSGLSGRGLDVVRVGGADRYETAAAVATLVAPGSDVPEVLVASGTAFPDGLVAGAAGAATGAPLVLTAPDRLPASTATALAELRPAVVTVAGGPSAVSDAVLEQLRGALPGAQVRRVAGEDRYATAAAVQQALRPSAASVLLASGQDFPDALAGGALGLPVLLSRPDCLPAVTVRTLEGWGTSSVVALGGTTALGDAAARGDTCG